MTILQMKCFLSLAKTKKMSETAIIMGLSLSTLSKYIDRMENELSAQLFYKKLSQQILTREGELIYPSVEYIVKQYDDQRAKMYRYTSRYESAINVAIGYHQLQTMQQLISFMKEHPEVKLDVMESPAGEICSMLDSGTADVGVVYEQLIDKKYPLTVHLRNDRLIAAVSENHPLAKRGAVSLSELRGDKYFLYRSDPLMYRYLLNVCIAAGFAPDVEHSDLRMSTILINVAAGNGVSLLTENMFNTLKVAGNAVLRLSENPTLLLCAVCAHEYPDKSLDMLMRFLLLNTETAPKMDTETFQTAIANKPRMFV